MNNTPNSNRTNIVLIGETNAGKSTLLNAIVGQEISIVSDIKGTTTDSVKKTMELIPYGPVLFTDTAGFGDNSDLGQLRIERTIKEIKKADFVIYVVDGNYFDEKIYEKNIINLKKYSTPYITVVTKKNEVDKKKIESIKNKIRDVYFIDSLDSKSILELKEVLVKKLNTLESDPSLLKGIVNYGETIIMVIPIDSEAPKGRIILPQVQILRDALDNGIKTLVVRDTELKEVIENYDKKAIKLIITDSQIFKKVDSIVNNKFSITSFSIIFARQKGELKEFLEGIKKIENLKDNSKVLMVENCSHNTSHEDIGKIKIPKLLLEKTGKNLEFEFLSGKDFPDDLSIYDLIIHCGGCMITRKNMINRISICNENNKNITNYGIVLAYINGILEKTTEIFRE